MWRDRGLDDEVLIERSCQLATELMARSRTIAGPLRRRRQQRLRRLLASPSGARLVFGLADRVLRPVSSQTAAAQLRELTEGPLDGLSRADAGLLRMAALLAPALPSLVVPLVGARLRYETRALVFAAEPHLLGRSLAGMRAASRRPNLNLLGEAVLGADEAAHRAATVEWLLRRGDVDCVSVKASAIAANLSLVDFEGSVERVREPLHRLYALAARGVPPKFVNLDMEEHRDLDLTVEAFTRALAGPEFAGLPAGIALQAYLPDSHGALDRLLAFAIERRCAGGAPVRVRLVKGANLAMETAGAELACWPPAPYPDKAATDASYKALLERLLRAARSGAVQVGVATHNLFDVAFAMVLGGELGATPEIEMLAGMADEQAAAVAERAGSVLLYTPVVARRDYRNALAYLARRLDENVTPEGFLRHALDLEPGSPAWEQQAGRFAVAVRSRHSVGRLPRHHQDRRSAASPVPAEGRQVRAGQDHFANEPATDFTLPANREWAAGNLRRPRPAPQPPLSSPDDVRAILARAAGAAPDWEAAGAAKRSGLLLAAADVMAAGRGEAVATMAVEAGKVVEEADTEVSEAVDYARWYALGAGAVARLLDEAGTGVASTPLGVVVVAPPWNFPYAIPAGGALAALAAGNTVVLKPAPEAPATSELLVHQLHQAGFSDDVVQLAPVADGDLGQLLVAAPDVGGVVLTGAHETALNFARWAPRRRLLAETSGKNALVVSATADIDQAVRDVVASAFGHAGQKCSAASLAIVVAPVYDNSPFLRQLADAVRSLRVGPATSPATQVGPIVGPFTPALRRALTELCPGEAWLVQPRQLRAGSAGHLWSPGVRTGVRPGSWAHMTEWFGPVLGVMRARDLDEALAWQNAVPYGLTAGLSSLSPNEQRRWADGAQAGNLYINRTTTGAVVGRQPFGGWKRSSHGPTAKAGGPNYLVGLRRWRDARACSTSAGAGSYARWWAEHYGRSTELASLGPESNELRYRPLEPGIMLRSGTGVPDEQVVRAATLSRLTGTPLRLSLTGPRPPVALAPAGDQTEARSESDEEFAGSLGSLPEGTRVRILGNVAPLVYEAAAQAGLSVLDEPICSSGRVELVRWLREQVVTRSLHRYGNVVYTHW
ncbi:MAG TPA: bifunctional proline dehydrogenase/L-glutamate gamma-semialdehyde dehydrogenase [Acidimicrobiales bacterium]|nr:bifunctional proline dehydrogenase/L-glutamate gamma-semialdehyde dehydrogenase [Acidimicrobiales bacterium]